MNKLIIFMVLTLKLITAEEKDIHVEIDTKLGRICGRKEIVDGKEANIFLGIPYAEPPLADLRFKKPIPIGPWKYPLKAFQWPNPCYQINAMERFFINPNVSEDCLYLNIFAPKNNSNNLLPVIIWIHGGSFVQGTSSVKTTIPTVLSTRGNVIVVAINYRLNTFGFFYAANDDAPGNIGIYDQIMALQWVKDNIESFGGDPNRVTLMGQSVGSMSVDIHLLSPLSRDLFNNAIMLSGSLLSHIWVDDNKKAYRAWLEASKIVGCGNGFNFTQNSLQCLRNLSAEKLLEMSYFKNVETYDPIYEFRSMVIFGDELLPKNPFTMLNDGNYKKGFSLLSGTTDDEGSQRLAEYDPITYNSSRKFTYDEANDQMQLIVSQTKSNITINSNDVLK